MVCDPPEIKSNPRNVVDCQFSIPYTVAVAVVNGDVFLDDFAEDAIWRSDVRETLKKVKPYVEPEIEDPKSPVSAARVTIKTNTGDKYLKNMPYIRGCPQNPMTMADVAEKLRKCLGYSARPFSEEKSEQLIEMINNLEEVDNVSKIVELLVP